RQRQLDTGSYETAVDESNGEVPEAEALKAAPGTSTDSPAAADASVAPDVSADEAAVVESTAKPVPGTARTSAELLEAISGKEVDAPLCFTCGTKMRPAGSCYVCEGCGSTSGCS
ncbi:MAG: vitamin B12-dependent ribonucleotide reductase, partial [Nocardioidaceae bacterium]|nr:vitamin B12-dependent ribonucleotide reductase [Nocardioidaceae bacterium]